MRPKLLSSGLCVLFFLAASLPVRAQRQTPPAVLPPGTVRNNGSIYVKVLAQSGTALSVDARVVMTTGGIDGPVTDMPDRVSQDEWAFLGLQVGSPYVIRVEAKGYRTVREYVSLAPIDGATKRVRVYMVPEGRPPHVNAAPPGHFLLSPAAQREVQQAIKKLKSGKTADARKHLEKALRLAPGHPGVNYLMALSYLREGQTAKAVPYLEKSLSIDPGEVPALLALATVRYQQSRYPEAIRLLKRAIVSAPGSWQAHWILAGCYVREKKYEQARREAKAALKAGKKEASRARLVLGEALAGLGQREQAIAAFETFLKENRHDPAAERVRAEVKRLRQPTAVKTVTASPRAPAASRNAAPPSAAGEKALAPAAPAASVPSAPPLATPAETPAELLPKANWAPPDVDAVQPTIVSEKVCPLSSLLGSAGRGAVEWVQDLQKFTAIEDYQSARIDHHGVVGTPFERRFNYLVFVRKLRPHLFTIEEHLDPPPVLHQMGAPLVALGSPALALVFHPDFQSDYAWTCEGLGEWKGERAWILHFTQRADRPTAPLQSFNSESGSHLLALKGRVWLSEKGDHVMRLETDLVKPVDSLELKREHFSIEYRLVRFHSHPVSLWLPEQVDLYILYRGRAYHNYSRFSHFELFWTGTADENGVKKKHVPQR
jgi:tetratricopeptide (TPR) repeat protein